MCMRASESKAIFYWSSKVSRNWFLCEFLPHLLVAQSFAENKLVIYVVQITPIKVNFNTEEEKKWKHSSILSNPQFSFSTSLNDFSSVGFKTEIYTFLLSLTSTNRKNFIKMNTFLALTHSRVRSIAFTGSFL